ncbi:MULTISPECIES: hypothetical protein [unclassified Variovorax]|uniref:hypothetical protein n=1 Tax=unclassified Variovorax TaxID=663243 RepID=UPI001BD327F1|nr:MULTISPECIES: hypothetical protein [unclassified Variovorax]
MVLPILVLPTAAPEVLHASMIAQAHWVRAGLAQARHRVAGAARGVPAPVQSMMGERAKLVHHWRRVARRPRRRGGTSKEHAMSRTTALDASPHFGTQELLGDCVRLMRLLLRRSRARLSHAHRRAIARATLRFDLHSATIRVLPAHADAVAWLLAAMHWWGCRHPAALVCKPLHPPTGIVRWLSGFEVVQQVDCQREVISKLPRSMALIERRSRELVAAMIRRRGVVALLPELLR